MSDPTPPSWVRTPDGRLEPFDADRIARSLFSAGAAVGLRDAFLCRELADGVVHFLATEGGDTPTLAEVAEVVARTVRELGQPALARAYEGRRPAVASAGVYAADVLAAHEAGQIELIDLDGPDHLAGVVLGDVERCDDGLTRAAIDQAREAANQFVAIDGLEYVDDVNETSFSLHEAGVRGVINLNVSPPPWANFGFGPLFDAVDREAMRGRADSLARNMARHHTGRPLEVAWHVGETDLGPDGRLEAACGVIAPHAFVSFVFDRPRRPISLGGGLTRRQHPAVLTRVGLNLVALSEQPGMLADVDRYVQRLGSLARLALSAAVQKREHLRRQNRRPITDGFLLDRARFVAVAQGLDVVVRLFTGWSMANGGPSLALGRRIAQRLNDVLRQDGRHLQLETFLDGMTPDAPGASVRSQMQAAGALHAIAEGGTLTLHLPREAVHTGATLAEELRRAWRETAVGRVVLASRAC